MELTSIRARVGSDGQEVTEISVPYMVGAEGFELTLSVFCDVICCLWVGE